MRSAAAAIAWEIGRRHRWGFIAVLSYLAALVVVRLFVYQSGRFPLDNEATFPVLIIVPLSSAVWYLLAVFSFGLSGDLAARASIYPARMFTLPVGSAALAGWPMLYGGVAIAAVWAATRSLGAWPADVQVPTLWPAAAGVVFLAWTQVIAWMPYPLRGLRVLVIIVWLSLVGIGQVLVLELQPGEGAVLAWLLPQIPLAYLCARFAVGRARQGVLGDWGWGRARVDRVGRRTLRPKAFASAARAQAWFEWRRHGRSLPLLVAFVLPAELLLLSVFRDTPELILKTLVLVFLTPPVLAAFAAATVSKSGPQGSDAHELSPFTAARPISSATIVAAKLAAALRSAVVAWVLVIAVVPLAIWLSGTTESIADGAIRVVDAAGPARAVGLGLLVAVVLAGATCKQLVRGLYVGMSGRAWLVRASVFGTLALLTVLFAVAPWVMRNETALVRAWQMLPWLLAVLAACKLLAAGWVAARLHANDLVSDRIIVGSAAAWLVLALALDAWLRWLADFPPSLPTYLLGPVAILAVPWVRLAAAPLAADWNRHRGRRPEDAGAGSWRMTASVSGAVVVLMGAALASVLFEVVSFRLENRSNRAIVVDGEEREYLLYVPESLDGAAAVPLVISMHGGAMWPAQQMRLSGWNRLADEHGFIVAYPAGRGSPRRWETFELGARLEEDVDFIAAMIDELESTYAIDAARIYVNGLSNGAGMALVLSCTLADRIAAAGLVAPAQSLPPGWCVPSRPVPMIAFQGDADVFVPYEGGPMYDPINPEPPVFPATREWVGDWARRNRCAPFAARFTVASDISRLEYRDCADGASVTLLTLHGGGHTWPGGERLPEWFAGRTFDSVVATAMMWTFFAAHPRR